MTEYRIKRRIPGFMKFFILLVLVVSLSYFVPIPTTPKKIENAVKLFVALWTLSGLTLFVFLSYQVTYDDAGIYIDPGGLKRLFRRQKHFVSFDELRRITPGFDRGGHGKRDWLTFGNLVLHTRCRRKDADELVLRHIFLDREELVALLQRLRDRDAALIDVKVIDALASG